MESSAFQGQPVRCIRIFPMIFAVFFFGRLMAIGQTTANKVENVAPYRLPLPVNEVVVTFHALDSNGLPVNDLKSGEIRVFDNELPARRIVAFDAQLDRPIRAGVLIDTSESMQQEVSLGKTLAERFIQSFFRQQSDRAFVMDFGYSSEFAQQWTSNADALSTSVRYVQSGKMNPLGGTALFDSIDRACLYGFGNIDPNTTSNFILLFSDGEDTASHSTLEEVLKACQRGNVAIYSFRIPAVQGRASLGPATLSELSLKSGGQVFPIASSDEEVWQDLRIIESEIRNQYRIVYSPPSMKHDGMFHRIALLPPDRVSTISVRSGYYAPDR